MQIPVNWQQADVSTFSNTLPNNDKVPQVQMPRALNNNYQIVGYVTGLFRLQLQNRVNSGGLYIVAYNILSSNQFNNQVYQQWCQKIVDLLAINMGQFGFDERLAQQVVTEVYQAYLGFIWSQYKQQLSQITPNNLWSTLEAAINHWHQLEQKLAQAKQGYGQPQMQMGYNQSQQMQNHNVYSQAVTGQPNFGTTIPNVNVNVGSNISSEGMYTMQPIETFDTGANNPYSGPTMANHLTPATTVPEMSQNVPQGSVDPLESISLMDVIVSPNENNNYDYIKVSDSIHIEPTFKSSVKPVYVGDYPYPSFYDPSKFMAFTIINDLTGETLEKILPIEKDMEYLRHELDDTLRARYNALNKDNKIIVPRSDTIAEYNGSTSSDLADVDLTIKLKGDVVESLPMLVIDNVVFTGSSDMEVEKSVIEYIKENVEHDESILPVHEYKSLKYHYLDVDKEGYSLIESLSSCADFASVGSTLKEALRTKTINVRTFNFINERLTDAINEFIKDSLSDDAVSIDCFVSDIMDLVEYYENNKPKSYLALEKALAKILGRSIDTMELDDGYAVVDTYINIQLNWLLIDLSALDLKKGECALISSMSNETLLDLIKKSIIRNRDNNQYARYRLITSDGYYLELVKGHLLDNVNLLKML